MKKKTNRRVDKSSDKENEKVARVLREFKEGKLKTTGGKLVTDRAQAIAIALSEAGVSNKSLEKSEMLSKAYQIKKALEAKLKKEILNDAAVKTEIINFFKKNPQPQDSDVHAFAIKMNMKPDEMETAIYSIFSDFISGGLSGGKTEPVDEKELALGIKTELEHTKDKEIASKIARDHLKENPEYYTKLQAAGL